MNSRSQILKVALKQMAAKGADGTSLREIAAEVGIRKPSIMYHFESKASLREAVLDEVLLHWGQTIPRLLEASTLTGLQKFEALTKELLSFFVADPNRASFLLREMLDRPEQMRHLIDSHISPWIKVVSQQVIAGIEFGEVDRKVEPRAFVWSLVNAVVANVALVDSFTRDAPPSEKQTHQDRLGAELVRMARAGLFAQPSITEPKSNQKESAHG